MNENENNLNRYDTNFTSNEIDHSKEYSYDFLLKRVYKQHEDSAITKNLALKQSKKIIDHNPLVMNNKTVIVNFSQIIQLLKQVSTTPTQNTSDKDHFIRIISNTLQTTVIINKKGYLILDKKLNQRDVEKVILNYLVKYKKCKKCNSLKTFLECKQDKEYIQCIGCNTKYQL